jgi:hypothetical protein
VDVSGADRLGISERLVDRGARLRLAARHGGKAEVAGRCVARRRVDADHREAGPKKLRPELFGRNVVGKMQLDGVEAGRLGAADPLQERQLAPEKTEIGGKAQHHIPLAARPLTCPPRPANMPAGGQKRSQPRIDRPSRRD